MNRVKEIKELLLLEFLSGATPEEAYHSIKDKGYEGDQVADAAVELLKELDERVKELK